jgi:hypothetical protein
MLGSRARHLDPDSVPHRVSQLSSHTTPELIGMKVLHEVIRKRDARMAVREEARAARTEVGKCRMGHGQAVRASGEGERVVCWRFGG